MFMLIFNYMATFHFILTHYSNYCPEKPFSLNFLGLCLFQYNAQKYRELQENSCAEATSEFDHIRY